MIQFCWLRPLEGVDLEVEALGPADGLELPFAVPLAYAEQAGNSPGVLLWSDPEQGAAGLCDRRVRSFWRRDSVTGLRLVIMRPGSGPGVVGLELVRASGEEAPVLAGTPYSEELLDWFRERRRLWGEFLGHEPRFVDYGFDQ